MIVREYENEKETRKGWIETRVSRFYLIILSNDFIKIYKDKMILSNNLLLETVNKVDI